MPRRAETAWTIKRLRDVWNYDPSTGVFSRKEKQRGGAKPSLSGRAGAVTHNGYQVISLDGVHFLAHRLAWAYVNGEWPDRAVEHINEDRLDNRISNLRLKWGKRSNGKSLLTQERLKELVEYYQDAGVFVWKVNTPRGPRGSLAGTLTGNGYMKMSVDGKQTLSHRAAWLYVHGVLPAGPIDHINGDTIDNRLSNLRAVTVSQNTHNTKKLREASKTGYPGVTPKRSMFMARITANNQIIHLGIYKTIAEARIARLLGEKKCFGHFTTWLEERDSVMPLGSQFIAVYAKDNNLYVLDANGTPQRIDDVKQIETIPVTEEGHVLQ
jgi:hypothetical protein